jgi:glycosyltransferase involved in cell wall biosynthesis
MSAPQETRRIIVAVCLRYYLPGYKSGGPVRTIANLVEHLGDEFDFRIVASDRDIHDTLPYPGIVHDAWQQVGKCQVFYASPRTQTLAGMSTVLNAIDYDVLYVNSFFDSRFTILPLAARRLGMLRQRPVIVAPRGEFAESALGIRSWKKVPFRMAARLAGLYSGVSWHASSEYEKADIRRRMGSRAATATRIAVNLPKPRDAADTVVWQPRAPGDPLRVVFLSRVAPMKNLDLALQVIAESPVPLRFDIYGMVDDEAYWARCRAMLPRMPDHVRVAYHGHLPPEQVGPTLAAYDVLFLPTLGENYGHVIAESLTRGTPVLISDRTPWRGLQQAGVGWDLPLDESGHEFRSSLETLAGMDADALLRMRQAATRYSVERLGAPEALNANRELLTEAVRQRR